MQFKNGTLIRQTLIICTDWNRLDLHVHVADNLAYPNPTEFQGDKGFSGFHMQKDHIVSYGTEESPMPGAAYLGCYFDSEDHMYPEAPYSSRSNMTIANCATHCVESGYEYFRMNFARDCGCGSIPPGAPGKSGTEHPKVSDSDCNMACTGDPTYACGGIWRSSAVRTRPGRLSGLSAP